MTHAIENMLVRMHSSCREAGLKQYLIGQVLLEFPCEVVGAVLAGKWAASASPLRPWFMGYRLRLAMAAAVTILVGPVHVPCTLSIFAFVTHFTRRRCIANADVGTFTIFKVMRKVGTCSLVALALYLHVSEPYGICLVVGLHFC